MSEQQLTAGAYLRKRREAAGLTIDEVVAGTAMPAHRETVTKRLIAIEADEDVFGEVMLGMLRGTFRFDPEIYRNLAAGLPAGTALCRNCACSWKDACRGKPANCHWAEPDLCSRCAVGLPATPAPSFSIDATDPHAVPLLCILSNLRLGDHDGARRELETAIGEDKFRQQVVRLSVRTIDDANAEAALSLAFDMTAWRQAHSGTLPGEVVHV